MLQSLEIYTAAYLREDFGQSLDRPMPPFTHAMQHPAPRAVPATGIAASQPRTKDPTEQLTNDARRLRTASIE